MEEEEQDHGLANGVLSCPNRLPGDSLYSMHLFLHPRFFHQIATDVLSRVCGSFYPLDLDNVPFQSK